MLDGLNIDTEYRTSALSPICKLAYMFDKRMAIPQGQIRPLVPPGQWEDTVRTLAETSGLIRVYEGEPGTRYLAFGELIGPPYRFVNTDVADHIVSWTFGSGTFSDVFQEVVKLVQFLGVTADDNAFPNYNTLRRLMEVYDRLAKWCEMTTENRLRNSVREFRTVISKQFGEVLLRGAR